jgi:sensor histidine kinase YesM
MHPLLARRAGLATYVLAALAGGVALAELLRRLVPQPVGFAHAYAVPLSLFYAFAMLAAWWVCRSRPLAGSPFGRVVLVQSGAAVQTAAVWVAAGTVWGVALTHLTRNVVPRETLLRDAVVLMATGIPLYLLSAVVHYLILAFEASRAAERRVLESQVSAREAELRALRAQLNPHFLFNSLNSINALVGSDPEGARRMCEGLGDFLRRTLALGACDSVTLGEELALVDRYLAIEQVRFGDRLQVVRDLEPEAVVCAVPPLLLQPLVENAIKHGIAGRVEGGRLRLGARVRDNRLDLVIENPVDAGMPAREGAGVGLENVRRRLDVFGARDARLEAIRGDDWFRVTLTLPATSLAAGVPRRD